MTVLSDNLKKVRQGIAKAAKANGRAADAVKLIAVSKGKPPEDVRAAMKAGQDVFGENRVQEAKSKFQPLRVLHPPLELHLIGPLQTNKVEDAVKTFDVIQTLDRPALAEALVRAMKKTGKAPKIYIQVNSGHEPQKSGIDPDELPMFLKFCHETCGLTIEGIMCIPPQSDDPKKHFKFIKKIADEHQLKHISMGMSADYEAAIECGATEVRVGSAIFGKRD